MKQQSVGKIQMNATLLGPKLIFINTYMSLLRLNFGSYGKSGFQTSKVMCI